MKKLSVSISRIEEAKTKHLLRIRRSWQGKAWLGERVSRTSSIAWECGFPTPRLHIGFELDGDRDDGAVMVHIGCLLFYLYVSLDHPKINAWIQQRYSGYNERVLSMRTVDDYGVQWSLWMPDSIWRSTDPKWRRGSFYLLDWLFGDYRFEETVLHTQQVDIPMPERTYTGTVKLYIDKRYRKRLARFAKYRRGATIKVARPPQFAGKGENSYDLDDDAIYQMSCDATSVEGAIEAYRQAVFENRRKYGQPSQV